MDTLQELQRWYHSQCDGDWEHENLIQIRTLDNPGWRVVIDLMDTDLEERPYAGTAKELSEPEHDWIHCAVRDGKWEGAGGALMLDEILRTFLAWAAKK
ncbi:immunity 53 family protein [Luteolibacter soli]|uniref:Immunity 53 family protein n=1 Tax=Luteolibacter soli TaxID=3135280 RepID=A0ABU9ASU0_9BACT